MYKTIEPFYEPENIQGNQVSEMTHEQVGFLCGLIKGKKPKKIVEVGVAAGGTTCIILNCLEKINCNTKVYSVDLSTCYYKNMTKKTGYLLEENKSMLKMYNNHRLITGKTLAECIDIIAPDRDIDFLILDTVHSLPGELLDIILSFPYLTKGATVVLHDIRLNHQDGEFQAFATKIVFDVVTAEKYLLWKNAQGINQTMEIDSIGAFDITDDTSKYIADLFSALTITWKYPPGDYELDIYRKVISKNYSAEYLQLWDSAVKMQKETIITKFIVADRGGVRQNRELNRKWNEAKKVCIYGFGYKGRMYLQYAKQMGLRVDAIVLSDNQPNVNNIPAPPIVYLSELSYDCDECSFINAGEKPESIKEIDNNIRYAGYYKIL